MVEKSFYETLQAIRGGISSGVYVLFGVLDGFAPQWLAQECKQGMDADQMDQQVLIVKYSLTTESLAQIVSDLTGGGLFASRSVALCSEFDVLTTTYKSKSDDGDLMQMIEWMLEHPIEGPLFLTTTAEKLDERRKVTKKLRNSPHITVVNAAKHSPKEWKELARLLMGNRQVLDAAQLDHVVAKTGDSLGLLAREMDKITTYAGVRTQLSIGELDLLVIDARPVEIFDVVKHFIEGRYALAAQLYNKVEDRSLFAFLALLARQYRLIARVGEAELRGYASGEDQDLAGRLGVHPYAIKVAREQSRLISVAQAKSEIEAIASMEYEVKSGGLTEKTALELWFMRHMAKSSA